jgi:hypothetical protein
MPVLIEIQHNRKLNDEDRENIRVLVASEWEKMSASGKWKAASYQLNFSRNDFISTPIIGTRDTNSNRFDPYFEANPRHPLVLALKGYAALIDHREKYATEMRFDELKAEAIELLQADSIDWAHLNSTISALRSVSPTKEIDSGPGMG